MILVDWIKRILLCLSVLAWVLIFFNFDWWLYPVFSSASWFTCAGALKIFSSGDNVLKTTLWWMWTHSLCVYMSFHCHFQKSKDSRYVVPERFNVVSKYSFWQRFLIPICEIWLEYFFWSFQIKVQFCFLKLANHHYYVNQYSLRCLTISYVMNYIFIVR